MLILGEENNILDTDVISESCHYSVLRFKDPKNPDFYFQELEYIEEFSSHTMKIEVGGRPMFVPFHWSILCSDTEYIQTIPLYEFSGRPFEAFSLNPIDGYYPDYPLIRIIEVFQTTASWSCPPMQDKDMLVIPIAGTANGRKGPSCVIMTPHKLDINRSIADIF